MRIRLLREAGGLGDTVRILGVARGIKALDPAHEVHYLTLKGYADLVRMSPDVDRVDGIGFAERRDRDSPPDPRRYGYLTRTGVAYDASVDLFCPADRYERRTLGPVEHDRQELWTQAVRDATGLPVQWQLPWLRVSERARGWALGWMAGRGLQPDRPTLGVQPLATQVTRSWSPWSWVWVLRALREAVPRLQIIVFGTRRPAWDLCDAVGGQFYCHRGFDRLAAVVMRCGLIACVDSGLLHLAAALDVPTIGLFGQTPGRTICARYPRASWIDGTDRDGLDCDEPCYGRWDRGRGEACADRACWAMERLDVDCVAEAILRRIS